MHERECWDRKLLHDWLQRDFEGQPRSTIELTLDTEETGTAAAEMLVILV